MKMMGLFGLIGPRRLEQLGLKAINFAAGSDYVEVVVEGV